jgi:hypothetical protein
MHAAPLNFSSTSTHFAVQTGSSVQVQQMRARQQRGTGKPEHSGN